MGPQRNLDPKQKDLQDIAAQNFLQLLMLLRSVMLQDVALLVDLEPDVPLWQHDEFQSIIGHSLWPCFKEHVELTHGHLGADDIHDFTQV